MGRACTVCESPSRVAIDEGLVQGRAALQLAQVYGVGERAIGRHKLTHLSPALAAVAAKRQGSEERRAGGLVDRLESLIGKIEQLVETAHKDGSAGQMLAAARELRACWELQAKLTGQLTEKPTTVVNVLSSPEIGELFTRLLLALAPWPEAKVAAAAAIDVPDLIEATA